MDKLYDYDVKKNLCYAAMPVRITSCICFVCSKISAVFSLSSEEAISFLYNGLF